MTSEEESTDANLAPISASTKSLSRYEKKDWKNLQPQIIGAFIATASHIVTGIALAYSAILIPQLGSKDSDIVASKKETSWFASIFALTSIAGSLLGGYLDKVGRINLLKVAVVPGVLGWILIAVAPNIPTLIVGRICTGLGSALSTSPGIVYVTEIARKDMRGSLCALAPAFVSLGMVITYFKGWLMNWRTVAWLCNIYTVVPFLLQFLIPESPAWLISKGRIEEARKSLKWLHKYQPQPEDQAATFAEMQLHLLVRQDEEKKTEAARTKSGIFKEFLKPTGYKPLLILCGVCFFQQYSGIYIFLFYSVTFFQDVGTTVDPYVASIWIGVIRFVMSLLNTWMFKKFTRRSLFMLSGVGMAIFTLLSGFFTLWIKNGTTTHTWVPVLLLLLYVISSMIGFLPLPWVMTAEFFPLKIRSLAQSICTSFVNTVMFVAVQNYVNMETVFGGSAGVQWFFSLVSFLAVIYIFVFLPETHKKTLLEIEEYFYHNTIYLGPKKKVLDVDSKSEKAVSDKLINNV